MNKAKRKRELEEEERAKRDRLAYIGTLAAGLVHEVRTPLNAMYLNVQLLEEAISVLPDDTRGRFEKRLSRVSVECKEVVKTLDMFLAFARPPRLEPVPTDLNHFLRELIEFSQPEFDQVGIRLTSSLADDMYPVVIDKGQFTHVFLNLFRNAREACETGPHGDGEITITSRELDSQIEILVDDNGVGVEPGDEEKIFELFFTTKEKGTGLGLGIVRRIIEDHGGQISASDLPEAGARFRILLPRGKFLELHRDSEGGA
ncbi:MAG: sensor histidine kinase [Planctomycetota bacterium]|jgi:signal transduction histidine kinase